jgi:hypothetical protein
MNMALRIRKDEMLDDRIKRELTVLARGNAPDVDYIFCLPGNPANGTQATCVAQCEIEMIKQGKKIGIIDVQGSDVEVVRNKCLGRTDNRKHQLPFNGETRFGSSIWVDSDNIVAPALLNKLIMWDKDIVAGWCRSEVFGFDDEDRASCGMMTYKPGEEWSVRPYTLKEMEELGKRGKLVEMDYTGIPFAVIKYRVFEAIGYPWFQGWPVEWTKDGVEMIGKMPEDWGFCVKAREKGFKIWVDPAVRVAHQKLTPT